MVDTLLRTHYSNTAQWYERSRISNQVRRFESVLPRDSGVLEIGCGSGVDTSYLLSKGHEVIPTDIGGRAASIRCKSESLPFPTQYFDGVYSRGVLHLCDLGRSISEIRRVTKLSGFVFISYPFTLCKDGRLLDSIPLFETNSWAKTLYRRVSSRSFGDHQHDILQWLGQNRAFHPNARLFIETVTGCSNKECTSPCSARDTSTSLMPITVCNELIKLFRSRYEIYLFGRGDCSEYPFECLDSPSETTVNIIGSSYYRIPVLRRLGMRVYARCDNIESLEELGWREADGVFCVAGSTTPYSSIAKRVLDSNKPFMVRSLCNNPKNKPPLLESCILEVRRVTGFSPFQVYKGSTPTGNCNVTTVKYSNGGFTVEPCIIGDTTLNFDTLKSLDSWFRSSFPVKCKSCYSCGTPTENYRLYYEPSLIGGL